MSFQDLVASVRRVASQAGLRLPMAKLNDAISIAFYNKHYSQAIAADHAGALPPAPNPPPFVDVAAARYGVDRLHLGRAIEIGRNNADASGPDASAALPHYRLPLSLSNHHAQQAALAARSINELYVSYGEMRDTHVNANGVVVHREEATPDTTPAFRVAIARGADGVVLLRFWNQEPPSHVLTEAVVSGVTVLRANDDASLLIGTSAKFGLTSALSAALNALGIGEPTLLRGAKALVARIRSADTYVNSVRFGLRHQAEGPPTIEELHRVNPEADGWFLVPWGAPSGATHRATPAWITYAEVITRQRGRDPKSGHKRFSRAPHNAPTNTHEGPVDEVDPLDLVPDSMLSREPYIYDHIVVDLIDVFRQWEMASTPAGRAAAQYDAVRLMLEGVVTLCDENPALEPDFAVSMITNEFGHQGVWKHQLYLWLAEAMAGGEVITGRSVKSYWLNVTLRQAGESDRAAGIRRLPEIPMLIECLRKSTGSASISIDLSDPLGMQRGYKREVTQQLVAEASVNTGLLALTGKRTRRFVGSADRHTKPCVLGTASSPGTRGGEWWIPFSCAGLPLPNDGLSSQALTSWESTVNLCLARWSSGTRVGGVNVRAGNIAPSCISIQH